MSSARHHVRVGLIEKCGTRQQRDWHLHGVHQIEVLFSAGSAWPHAENAVLAVEVDDLFFWQIVRNQVGNAPTKIHACAVRQFAGGALGDLFASEAWLAHVRRVFA